MMRPALAAMAVLVLVPRFRLVTEFHLCLGYAPAYRWPPSLSGLWLTPLALAGAAAILARVRPTRTQLRPAKHRQNMYNLVG
jgi:hypothetical protein